MGVSGPGWPAKSRPPIRADYDSTCIECGEEIEAGDTIRWSRYHDMYICDLCGRAEAC